MRSLALLFLAAANAVAQTPRQLVEDLRLDANAEDFPSLRSFSVGPKGQIVIPIDADQQLRFYDASGKKLGAFGRKGSGPGEFRRIGRMGWLGDTLWVGDFDLSRVTFLTPARTLLRTEVVSPSLNAGRSGGGRGSGELPAQSVYMFTPWSVTQQGKLAGPGMIVTGKNVGGTLGTESVVLVTSAEGSDRRIIAHAPNHDDNGANYIPGDGSVFYAAVPFTYTPFFDYASDGSRAVVATTAVTATTSAYSVIAIRIPSGDTIFSRTYQAPPVKIPSSVMDSAISAIGVGQNGKQFYPPGVADKLRDMVKPKAPVLYAPLTGFVVGIDNSLWIIHRRNVDRTIPVTGLDAKGNPVVTATLSKNSRLIQASLTHLWVIETDDDGLGSVVRYRLK